MLSVIQQNLESFRLNWPLYTIDKMESFAKATYVLEGDGVLVLSAYGQLHALHGSISLEHYLNVNAVAKKLSQGNSEHKQQLVSYSKECVKPAYNYFKHKFNNNLQQTVKAFKAA